MGQEICYKASVFSPLESGIYIGPWSVDEVVIKVQGISIPKVVHYATILYQK